MDEVVFLKVTTALEVVYVVTVETVEKVVRVVTVVIIVTVEGGGIRPYTNYF